MSEVVVTSRKKAENIQNVPLSISAVSEDALTVNHFEGLEEIGAQVPGLHFTSFLDSFNGNVTMRGLQQDDVQDAVGNVGSFLDGIYLQRGYQVDASIGDFDRIEVVRGPQSALYGENTFAGAINYVLKQPTDEFHLDGSGTVGNGNLAEEHLGVGGPIIKGLLDFRAYVAQSDYDGVWRNNFPGAEGDSKYLGGHKWQNYSGSLKLTPFKNFSVTAEYYNIRRQQDIDPYLTIDGDSYLDHLNCGAPSAGGGYSLWCGDLPTKAAGFRTGVGNPPPGVVAQPQSPTMITTKMWKVAAAYRINDDFNLTYTHGDADGSVVEQASFSTDAYNPDPVTNFGFGSIIAVQREGGLITYDSDEVRLAYTGPFPIKGEIGYFHSNANDHYVFGLTFVPSGVPYASETSSPTDLSNVLVPFDNQDTTYQTSAPFGRLSYSFLDDKATVSAEVRATQTTLTLDDLLARASNPNLPLLKATYNDVTPRFTAQYKLTPDQLFYASAARGVKAGGFNGYVSGSLTLVPSQQSYGEETNWTYEVGYKASLLEHTLVVDADLFYIDWDNKQEAVVPIGYVVVNSQSAGVVPTIFENVGNAYSYGFELASQWRPTPHITGNLTLTIQNPRFSAGAQALSYTANCNNIVCLANGGVAGNQIELTSIVTSDIGLEYHDYLPESYLQNTQYFIGFDASFRSKEFVDDTDTAALAPFWLTNGHLTFQHDNFTLSIWAKNIFNQIYASSSFSIPSIYQYNYNLGDQRTFGATLSVKY